MSKVKEIIKLKQESGMSIRNIAASCGCEKSTVEEVLSRAKSTEMGGVSGMSES